MVGAIPVERSSPQGLVDKLAKEFEKREELLVLIPPEGTRAKREYWRSGFYHIARKAQVPICLSYLDYGRKEAGIGLCIHPSGDVTRDMDRIREFYKDVHGKVPENFTYPRLMEEGTKLEDEANAAGKPPGDDASAE